MVFARILTTLLAIVAGVLSAAATEIPPGKVGNYEYCLRMLGGATPEAAIVNCNGTFSPYVSICQSKGHTQFACTQDATAMAYAVFWEGANERCRGGTEEPATSDACDERQVYSEKLQSMHWCEGHAPNQRSMLNWSRCD
jgi:hypothetical protein